MYQLEIVNELTLRATCLDGQGALFTKAGAMIGYNGQCKFEKVLLGPQGNPMQAIIGQVFRRLTGENLPLMKVKSSYGSYSFYADFARHVTVVHLNPGQQIMVESEDLLAFTESCKYSSRLLAQGVISQKGFFTSVLTGQGQGASVAILTAGNPLVLDSPCCADPDAVVAWTGSDPGFKLDVSWKNLIGQASGESYMFEWKSPGSKIVVQPSERKSGVDIGIDGHGANHQPQMQNNQTIGGMLGGLGGLFGGGR
jgi:uncharacterized protein (AIM24 family)